jgi:hypothetical protein
MPNKRPAELDDIERQPEFQRARELATTGNIVTRVPSECDHVFLWDGEERGFVGEPVVYCGRCGAIGKWPPE